MKSQLSTKTRVLVLKDGTRFFLDEKEADLVKQAIKNRSYLEIGESLISPDSFHYLTGQEQIDMIDKQKKGEWKCKYGYWHEKNQQCGHGLLARD